MDPQQAQLMARHMFVTMFPVIFLFWLVKVTLYIIPLWQICKKAGFSGPIALLAAIPLIGRLLVLYIVGFSTWKVAPIPAAPYYPTSYPPPPPPGNPPAPPPTL